jgi:hypothetical protein
MTIKRGVVAIQFNAPLPQIGPRYVNTTRRGRIRRQLTEGVVSVLCRKSPNVLRLLSGCRYADAESAVGSPAMRLLQRTDLGSERGACRTIQNLHPLHRSRRAHEIRGAKSA